MMAVSADWTMSRARMSGRTSLVTVMMKAKTVRVVHRFRYILTDMSLRRPQRSPAATGSSSSSIHDT